jgi:hypothetical protein
VFVQHTLYGQQGISATGDVSSGSGFTLRSRTAPSQVYTIYAHDNLLAFWFDNYGDYLTIERGGGKVFAQGLYETNAGLQLDDPFYAARTRYWTLYAVQGIGYLWSNSNAAGGGIVAFAADWATGVVTFPHGVNLPGGLLFTDSTFNTQTWKLWAHDGMAYLSSTNSYDWTIGSQYSTGNVFINKRLYLYSDMLFTANPTYIYFNNDGGTFLSVDTTNWVSRLGVNNGGFYFQRHDGTNMTSVTSTGAVFMGVVGRTRVAVRRSLLRGPHSSVVVVRSAEYRVLVEQQQRGWWRYQLYNSRLHHRGCQLPARYHDQCLYL